MIITFNKGILGLEYLKEYEISELSENIMFKEMNSLEEEKIGFIIVSPFDIDNKYDIELDENTINELEIENPEDVLLYNILSLNKSIESSTVNLRAPIVINIKNNLAKQVVLQDEKYKIKHPIMRRM